MIRLFLRETNCPNCKHNTKECSNYESCFDCPMATDGYCFCLQDATDDELKTCKCKYYEEKE